MEALLRVSQSLVLDLMGRPASPTKSRGEGVVTGLDRKLGKLIPTAPIDWDDAFGLPLAEELVVTGAAAFHGALRSSLGLSDEFEFSEASVFRVHGDDQLHIQALVRSPGRGFFHVSCLAAPYPAGDPLPVGLTERRR